MLGDVILVFDKDGVITDTESFKLSLLENLIIEDFPEFKDQIISCNRSHRGMFRSVKIPLIFQQVLQKELSDQQLNNYLEKFAFKMKRQLQEIKLIPGVAAFIKQKYGIQFISSAAPAEEVNEHIAYFGFNNYFEGIYASPTYTDKTLALQEIKNAYNKEIIFFGDSLSDFEHAKKADVHFVGITCYSNAFDGRKDIFLLADFTQAAEKISNHLF